MKHPFSNIDAVMAARRRATANLVPPPDMRMMPSTLPFWVFTTDGRVAMQVHSSSPATLPVPSTAPPVR